MRTSFASALNLQQPVGLSPPHGLVLLVHNPHKKKLKACFKQAPLQLRREQNI